MLGRESAIDGASADMSGGRRPLVEREGSKEDVMLEDIAKLCRGVFLYFDSTRQGAEDKVVDSDSDFRMETRLLAIRKRVSSRQIRKAVSPR